MTDHLEETDRIENHPNYINPNYFPCGSCRSTTHYSQLDSHEGLCAACVRSDWED